MKGQHTIIDIDNGSSMELVEVWYLWDILNMLNTVDSMFVHIGWCWPCYKLVEISFESFLTAEQWTLPFSGGKNVQEFTKTCMLHKWNTASEEVPVNETTLQSCSEMISWMMWKQTICVVINQRLQQNGYLCFTKRWEVWMKDDCNIKWIVLNL